MSRRLFKLKYVLALLLTATVSLLTVLFFQNRPNAAAVDSYTLTEMLPITGAIPVLHGKPIRLLIPSLNVDASIEHVGLTVGGDMDAPKVLADAGWYLYGSHPGDEGSAVIAGHVGGSETPGVFKDLHTLQKDDRFSVIDEQGQTVNFIVRELKTYGLNDHPEEVFRGGGKHLNLITCTGVWDDSLQTFKDRLVVFADKAD